MYINPNVTVKRAVREVAAHEIGHTFGLENCDECSALDSVMGDQVLGVGAPPNNTGRIDHPSSCDNQQIAILYASTPTPLPTPEPTLLPPVGTCGPDDALYCSYRWEDYCFCRDTGGTWQYNFCYCWYESPILIDVQGDGFNLTDAEHGVQFDFLGHGVLCLDSAWFGRRLACS